MDNKGKNYKYRAFPFLERMPWILSGLASSLPSMLPDDELFLGLIDCCFEMAGPKVYFELKHTFKSLKGGN